MLGGVASGVLLVVAFAGGCGDDDEGASTSDGPLTREEYIAAGDALCRGFIEDTEALQEPEPETREELAAFLGEALALGEEVSAGFAAMEPPADAAEVHQALRSSLDESIPHVRAAQEAVEAGDGAAAQAALDLATDVGDDSDEAARAYGFEVCGSESELRDE